MSGKIRKTTTKKQWGKSTPISDVVETLTFVTETLLKLRDRDRDFIKNPETET